MDVVQYLLLYLVLGACAGVLAGLFGVGGGLIIVPVLVFSFAAQGFAGVGQIGEVRARALLHKLLCCGQV